MRYKILCAALLAVALPVHAAPETQPESLTIEARSRQVDQAALDAQKKALSSLKKVLDRYRGTSNEAAYLFRMAEIHQQNAAIYFRIAHGKLATGAQLNLSEYKGAMRESITQLDRLISKYPSFGEIHLAYFMRGKAYEETGDKKSATQNYLHLVKHYPEEPESISAYMSLAEFAITDNNHKLAITYLKKVEERPSMPQYPFALFKMGWSYYNLKDVPQALAYLEKHISYYDRELSSAEATIRESSFMDIPLFYFEGFELKNSSYDIAGAFSYFKKLGPGQLLGRMTLRFSKMLRAHGHAAALAEWKALLIKDASSMPETIETVRVAFEDQWNRRLLEPLVQTSKDITFLFLNNDSKLTKSDPYRAAEKLLIDTAKELRSLIIKNKKATKVSILSTALAGIYDSFIQIVSESDPRVPAVHVNMAEILFEIRQFEEATTHYRWVVDNASRNSAADIRDASLKSIASRYEVLRDKKLVPEKLDARPLKDGSNSDLQPLIKEWITWIDEHQSKYGKTSDETFENFQFEANRVIYSQGRLELAHERLVSFIRKKPSSKYAIPSGTLAIDTLILSTDWRKTNVLSTEFLAIKSWQGTSFDKRLSDIAADSSYKLIEIDYEAGKYESVVSLADKYVTRYYTHPRLADALLIAGKSAQKLEEDKKAEKFYEQLIEKFPKSQNLGPALVSMASMYESRYDFLPAARNYKKYIDLKTADPKIVKDARRKIIELTWLSGDLSERKASLALKQVCTGDLEDFCLLHKTLLVIDEGADPQFAFEQAQKAPKDLRAIWAAVALRAPEKLAFRDRLVLTQIVASHWDSLDKSAQFRLMPEIATLVPRVFKINREALDKTAPLKATERSITRRVEYMREIENFATKAIKIPFVRVRAAVLNEIASLYVDLSQGLAKVPEPKDLPEAELAEYRETIQKLVLPFEEKSQDLRLKALEAAGNASVETETFRAIADPFFTENPSQAVAIRGPVTLAEPDPIDLDLLDDFDGDTDWDDSSPSSHAELVRSKWSAALKRKNWAQVVYFAQEIERIKAATPVGLKLARAISFAAAGAKAEALTSLSEIRDDLSPKLKERMTMLLFAHYASTLSKEKPRKFLSELMSSDRSLLDIVDSKNEAFLIVYTAAMSGVEIPAHAYENLLIKAAQSGTRGYGPWADQQRDALDKKRKLAAESKSAQKPVAGAKKIKKGK